MLPIWWTILDYVASELSKTYEGLVDKFRPRLPAQCRAKSFWVLLG